MSEQAPTKNLSNGYFNSPADPDRLRRLEVESWLGPPDNTLGAGYKWLEEQREYTLMQADALLAKIKARRAK